MRTNLPRGASYLLLVSLISFIMSPGACFGQGVKVGEPAPEFSVSALDGQRTLRLSDFRGRRLLIFTWASW